MDSSAKMEPSVALTAEAAPDGGALNRMSRDALPHRQWQCERVPAEQQVIASEHSDRRFAEVHARSIQAVRAQVRGNDACAATHLQHARVSRNMTGEGARDHAVARHMPPRALDAGRIRFSVLVPIEFGACHHRGPFFTPPNFHELPLRKITYVLAGSIIVPDNHSSITRLRMYTVCGVTN